MKIFFLSFVFSFFGSVYGQAILGTIKQFQGSVKVKNEGSIKKNQVSKDMEINAGDLISTDKKSTVKFSLLDGSVFVLDENSSIHFLSNNEAAQNEGKILYKIRSRDAKNSLKVKTPFAIIGVKGTTFIINTRDNASVSLKEGLIGIQSVEEEFELYREKVQKKFESFITQQNEDFQKYKAYQDKYAQVELTKEFDLREKNRVSFEGNRVNEESFGEMDEQEFRYFEELIKSMD